MQGSGLSAVGTRAPQIRGDGWVCSLPGAAQSRGTSVVQRGERKTAGTGPWTVEREEGRERGYRCRYTRRGST